MNNRYLTLPAKETGDYGYGLAYRLAREAFTRIESVEQQCRKCGAQYIDSGKFSVNYLNQPYIVTLPDAAVSPASGGGTLPVREKILILHYFLQAKGTPLSNKLVTYKELKDGVNYFPTFTKRAISPLVKYFGGEPQRLVEIAGALGGHEADYGDAGVTITAFPRVPVTLVLWKGDAEFAPEANIMFDSTVNDYLTNDDIHSLCEIIAWGMVRLLKSGGDNPGKS